MECREWQFLRTERVVLRVSEELLHWGRFPSSVIEGPVVDRDTGLGAQDVVRFQCLHGEQCGKGAMNQRGLTRRSAIRRAAATETFPELSESDSEPGHREICEPSTDLDSIYPPHSVWLGRKFHGLRNCIAGHRNREHGK